MEGEIAELMVEAQPLVTAVAIANNLVLGVVDMPLRNIADRMFGRDGNTRPHFMLRIVVVRGEKTDGLCECGLYSKKSWDGGEAERYGSAEHRVPAKVQIHSLFLCGFHASRILSSMGKERHNRDVVFLPEVLSRIEDGLGRNYCSHRGFVLTADTSRPSDGFSPGCRAGPETGG